MNSRKTFVRFPNSATADRENYKVSSTGDLLTIAFMALLKPWCSLVSNQFVYALRIDHRSQQDSYQHVEPASCCNCHGQKINNADCEWFLKPHPGANDLKMLMHRKTTTQTQTSNFVLYGLSHPFNSGCLSEWYKKNVLRLSPILILFPLNRHDTSGSGFPVAMQLTWASVPTLRETDVSIALNSMSSAITHRESFGLWNKTMIMYGLTQVTTSAAFSVQDKCATFIYNVFNVTPDGKESWTND